MTGARTSGGACGLIRRNAKNLTWAGHVGSTDPKGEGRVKSGADTGGAWLSSARAVRCWVKSRNERNPYPMLRPGHAEHSWGTAGGKLEEGGDDVKSSCPGCPGPHTCYNGRYKAQRTREGERIAKSRSQFRSEAATRLREGGIASKRGSAGRAEYVPGPCTHRPSHHESRRYQKSLS